MFYTITEIHEILRKKQTGSRFVHTLGVQYTSACLAMRYGADLEKAQIAGVLHDCAKHMKPEKLLEKCRKHDLLVTHSEIARPFLLHGRVGAYIARKKYGVDDPDILNAIEWHTTGRPEMSLLEKIVFTADYIEPNRNKAPNLEKLRKISFEDLDRAVYLILEQTLEYLQESPQDVDEMSEVTFRYYKDLLKL